MHESRLQRVRQASATLRLRPATIVRAASYGYGYSATPWSASTDLKATIRERSARLAAREKQIQQHYRPVISVHKWFARRPGRCSGASCSPSWPTAPSARRTSSRIRSTVSASTRSWAGHARHRGGAGRTTAAAAARSGARPRTPTSRLMTATEPARVRGVRPVVYDRSTTSSDHTLTSLPCEAALASSLAVHRSDRRRTWKLQAKRLRVSPGSAG
jgi:hypothetical protein